MPPAAKRSCRACWEFGKRFAPRFARSSCAYANICSCAGQPDRGRGGAAAAARLPRRRRREALRRTRGARDPLLRGARTLDPQPRSGELADALPLDDQPLQGMHSCLRLLLCPPHPQVPGLRRRPGLRARDRGQGQCARGAARRAGTPLLEARARRARHQHGPLSMGRGSLPADAGDLGGAARRREPVLGADQVSAAAARPAADARDRASARASAPACRSRPSTRGHGGRPSRIRPTRERAWRPWPS